MRPCLAVLLCLLPLSAWAQDDPLAVTLPTGKVVHFQTAQAKAAFLAARAKTAAEASATRDKLDADMKARRDRDEADKQAVKDDAERSRNVMVKVIQILPDGILAQFELYAGNFAWNPDQVSPATIFVECKPANSWVDGTIFHISCVLDGTYEYVAVNGANKRIEKVLLGKLYDR